MANKIPLRKRAKQKAFASLMRRPSAAMLAVLCWATPSILLNILLNFASIPEERFWVWYAVLSILDLLISAPLFYGLAEYLLRFSRGELPGVTEMFSSLSSPRLLWRALRLDLSLKLRMLLWVGIPVGIPLALWLLYLPENAVRDLVLAVLALILLFLLGMKAASYYAGYVLALDDAGLGVWRAGKEGARLFRGRFRELLAFALSFFPWIVAMVVILFLPSLTLAFTLLTLLLMFLLAYIIMAFLTFADELHKAAQADAAPPEAPEN